jgi:hypothetical protein
MRGVACAPDMAGAASDSASRRCRSSMRRRTSALTTLSAHACARRA